MDKGSLGVAGRIARAFIASPLTPLILLASLAFGAIALITLPREEEPQISVPLVDIHVSADGLAAADVVKLVTEPLETIVKSIDGVEHVYSQTRDDGTVVTARFFVGTSGDAAVLRVHEKLRANMDRIPVGVPEPLVVGRAIDDVAVAVLAITPKPEAAARWTPSDLTRIAHELQNEASKIEDVGLTYIVGEQAEALRVDPDIARLSLAGLTLQEVAAKIQGANQTLTLGQARDGGAQVAVVAGRALASAQDIGNLVLTTRDGRPVYLRDVAKVSLVANDGENRVSDLVRGVDGAFAAKPVVALAIAKRAGANAVDVTKRLAAMVASAQGRIVPADVDIKVTRDYGRSASDKADELLFHLGLATLSIVALVAVAIGRREALVIAVVIPATILLTLFAAKAMGYTLNRVSLFALIFSIGILVDDAIVIIENISRHWSMGDGRRRAAAAIDAVAEVGNPTIVATLTVVAALLPMLFVSGLMGPYMSPIPAVASAAMVFSFFIAVTVTPWLMLRVGRPHGHATEGHGALGDGYARVARFVMGSKARAWTFLGLVGVATLASMGLFATQSVVVKLLPFDDKTEIAAVLDLPAGSSLEETDRTLGALAAALAPIKEIVGIQSFAGTAAPFNFNGLVRHYYLRQEPQMGDLQINLAPRGERARASHAIAKEVRDRLRSVPLPAGSALKIVEPPPGPPVLATLLAEIYGPDAATRRAVAKKVRQAFDSASFIVDVDDTLAAPPERLRVSLENDQLDFFKVEHADAFATLRLLGGVTTVGYSHRGEGRTPLPIQLARSKSERVFDQATLATPIPANLLPGDRGVVELGDVATFAREPASPMVFRRNGRDAEMVTAELAGTFEAPLYGMLTVRRAIDAMDWTGLPKPEISLHGQPDDLSRPTLLWDGEWEVTWVTFRDMGAAFIAALFGIYVLVVAQFGSFKAPLVILTPVPLTLIGILVGHWLLGAPFTATSMIGFIALAGIIVRNSILLVDFIRHAKGSGAPFKDVLIDAGATRFKPILLTALAAMIGAATILSDPIFQGLAISLLFGLASSTLLTVLVVPAIYYVLRDPG